jgi:hypothetical protein
MGEREGVRTRNKMALWEEEKKYMQRTNNKAN